MNSYSKKLFIEIIFLIILVDIGVMVFGDEKRDTQGLLEYTVDAAQPLILETYYSENEIIDAESVSQYTMQTETERAEFSVPLETSYLRLDLGMQPSSLALSDIKIEIFGKEYALTISDIKQNIIEQQGIDRIEFGEERIEVVTNMEDPYLLINLGSIGIMNTAEKLQADSLWKKKTFLCIFFDILILLMYFLCPTVFMTPFEVLRDRQLVFDLARNDFKTRYVGSYFGIFWAFMQPLVTVVLYWFVFQVGLGSGPVDGYPFVVWLVAGLVPWMFFQDALLFGTNSLMEYSYLVKKVVFDVDILPMIKVISALFVHALFLGIALLLFTFMGYFPGLFCIQILYYSLCAGVFGVALSYCTSAVVLFFRDLSQIINIALQIGTWMTPILWQIKAIPQAFAWIFRLNPMYYVVQGYRDSVLYHVWFFERINETSYFWIVTILIFALGNSIFQRLKPHFSDVL